MPSTISALRLLWPMSITMSYFYTDSQNGKSAAIRPVFHNSVTYGFIESTTIEPSSSSPCWDYCLVSLSIRPLHSDETFQNHVHDGCRSKHLNRFLPRQKSRSEVTSISPFRATILRSAKAPVPPHVKGPTYQYGQVFPRPSASWEACQKLIQSAWTFCLHCALHHTVSPPLVRSSQQMEQSPSSSLRSCAWCASSRDRGS